jgi:hypothetical protein
MFPYALTIPKNLKQFLPKLNILMNEHDCTHVSKARNGVTTVILQFKSAELRTNFVADLQSQFPAYAGLGIRLLATNQK